MPSCDIIELFEPPKPIQKSIYTCDKRFHLEEINEMYKKDSKYGLVLISGNRTICYLITKSGTHISEKVLDDTSVKLQRRQRKGGSSAPRYGRIREEKEHHYVNKIVNMIIDNYMIDNNEKYLVNGIILAGPAEMKHKVSKEDKFKQYFDDRLLGIINAERVDEQVIWEIHGKCLELFGEKEDKEVCDVCKKIDILINVASNKLVFGFKDNFEELKSCNLEYMMIDVNLEEDVKKSIYELTEYGCKIYEKNGFQYEIVGIKWF